MKLRFLLIFVLFLFESGCAQLPQSSVVLSNSISDDVVSMQKAHKEFINYYYDGLDKQANDLIDNKYRPSLIRQVIEYDTEKFKDPKKKHLSLFGAVQKAFIDNKKQNKRSIELAQSNAMAGMKIFYTKIDKKVELKRRQLLDPLKQQRQALIGRVDSNYSNIIKKNTAITALLNSIVEVHETQQELFSMAGAKENLRNKVGGELSNLANKIDEIKDKIDDKSSKVQEVEETINKFKKLIGKD